MKKEYRMVGYHADTGNTLSVDVSRERGSMTKVVLNVHNGFALVDSIELTRDDVKALRPIFKHALRDKR